MIVKNEELLLPISIASIYDAVDEIVVLDNESTDNTIETLQPFADKVKLLQSASQDFSDLRNMVLFNSNDADFIIKIDADEILFEKFAQSIRPIAAEMIDKKVHTMKCWFYHMLKDLRHIHNEGEDAKDPRYHRIFMFRNAVGQIKWVSPVHEYLLGLPEFPFLDTELFYMHLGYSKSQRAVFNRWKLYSDLEGQEHFYDGTNPETILDDRQMIPYNGLLPEALIKYLDKNKMTVEEFEKRLTNV
jgi:glycosyltransferase involved in cell wall biosynthesis